MFEAETGGVVEGDVDVVEDELDEEDLDVAHRRHVERVLVSEEETQNG